ncbi:hypothetical protein PSU4_47000 [Pseudonocardia sulfidoxydans NBRC 16205]|uniref:Secreted protein n=1 Tax=Pseudonocardia sulfidoxydans NBRC 16205 TaxID=1223511 RepID=A0A511DLQ2_9PSEU|nr:hypothetical protein PSU4_47000 [Pseudonocardia sulfidoxydans NBRC 16205]
MLRRLAIFTAATAVMLAGFAGQANAATSNPQPPPAAGSDVKLAPNGKVDNPDTHKTGPAKSTLTGADSSSPKGGVTTQQVAPNPYGCYGQTDFPHQSSGDASTHSRTVCSINLVELRVTNDMYRGRWYGPEYLASGSNFRNYATSSNDAVARWRCAGVGIYTYETDSNHSAFDGGQWYYGGTTNNARFNC